MPIIELDVKRSFNELIGLNFKNEELKEYHISEMFEAIKLSIDEEGAKVENMAVMVASRSMVIN